MANSEFRSTARDVLTAERPDGLIPAAEAKRFIEAHGKSVRIKNGAALLTIKGDGGVEYLGASHGYVDVDDILDTLDY
jgi:hypothetical protein